MPRVPLPLCLRTLGACATILSAGRTEFYDSLTESDLVLAVDTMQRALEHQGNGKGLSWSNEETGHPGSVPPRKPYVISGVFPCRSYPRELQWDGRAAGSDTTACRKAAGVRRSTRRKSVTNSAP